MWSLSATATKPELECLAGGAIFLLLVQVHEIQPHGQLTNTFRLKNSLNCPMV